LRHDDADLIDGGLIGERRILELQAIVAIDLGNTSCREPDWPIIRPMQ
jgi:hypothetical protein